MTTANATSALLNLTLIRMHKLYEIFESSGCKDQACKSLLIMMPDVRTVNTTVAADKAVIKSSTIK